MQQNSGCRLYLRPLESWGSWFPCFAEHTISQCFFQAVFGCQNDTLKFWNDTLNSENQNMDLLCIEVKRFEINTFSCTWP